LRSIQATSFSAEVFMSPILAPAFPRTQARFFGAPRRTPAWWCAVGLVPQRPRGRRQILLGHFRFSCLRRRRGRASVRAWSPFTEPGPQLARP
jgi:hypothetical protein